MNKKVLVIGASGSGKTYLTKELRKFGLHTVDADLLEGFASWFDGKGNNIVFPENADKTFFDNHSFLWEKDFLINYLKDKENIYLFGLSGNVFELIDLFDKVYFLQVPPAVLEKRLQHVSRENPMGKTEEQRKIAVDYAKEIEEKARKLNIEFIDGTLIPNEIYQLIK